MLGIDGRAEKLLQRLNVLRQRLASGVGQAVESLWLPLHKPLLHPHIPGFFEPGELRTQIAVRGAGFAAQPSELRLLHAREQRDLWKR